MRTLLATALAALTLTAPRAARADDLRLTAADVTQITTLVRTMFEAIRDGNRPAITAALPTRAEFSSLFLPGTQPLLERHTRALERDTRELKNVFDGAVFVGIDASFAAGRTVRTERCGRFGARGSQCANGPIIEYRVGASTRHIRIDRLVRLPGNVWKIYDVRL